MSVWRRIGWLPALGDVVFLTQLVSHFTLFIGLMLIGSLVIVQTAY